MTTIFRRMLVAAALTIMTAFGMTAVQAVTYPDVAQAGVLGSIKGAAKAVGGGVKSAAKAVGSTAKRVGVGVGTGVKRGAVAVAKSPVAEPFKAIGRGASRAGTAVKILVTGHR
ncbi:MAG TPA: hypothetical protein VFP74_17825 [Pseudolabrys sp.]|nr:hypothetical protein [Pseudolabrys sp.]